MGCRLQIEARLFHAFVQLAVRCPGVFDLQHVVVDFGEFHQERLASRLGRLPLRRPLPLRGPLPLRLRLLRLLPTTAPASSVHPSASSTPRLAAPAPKVVPARFQPSESGAPEPKRIRRERGGRFVQLWHPVKIAVLQCVPCRVSLVIVIVLAALKVLLLDKSALH